MTRQPLFSEAARHQGPCAAWRRTMRFAAAVLALAGCGSEVTTTEVCELPAHEIGKTFLVGDDVDGAADDPRFSMAVEVQGGSFDASTLARFEPYTQPARFDITEGYLIGRHDNGTPDGRVVMALRIDHHLSNACTGPLLVASPCPNDGLECPPSPPWHVVSQMQVDWTRNLVSNDLWSDGVEPRWP